MQNQKTCPRQQRDAIPSENVNIFQNTRALRGEVEGVQKRILARARAAGPFTGNDLWATGNFRANLSPHIDGEFAANSVLLDFLEKTPEYLTAAAIVEPILKACAELDARDAELAERRGRQMAEHRDALATAEKLALETAQRDPRVVEARRALANV